MAIHRPVRLWRARAAAGQELGCAVAPDAQGWIQMIAGEVTASETPAEETPASARAPGPSVPYAGEGDANGPGAVGRTRGVLRQGDGLGFAPGRLTSLKAGDEGADLLLFELR